MRVRSFRQDHAVGGRRPRPHPRVEHHLALPVAGLELGQGFQLGQGHGVFVVVGFHDFHLVLYLSEECGFEVAPSPQTHENGPTWAFPGRPAASAHQALLGFCGVPAGRVRPPAVMRLACAPDGRQSPAALWAGYCHRVGVASWCGHLLGMGFRRDGISAGWDFGNPSWGRRPDVSTTRRRGVSARCAGPDAATGRSFAVVSARLLAPIRRRLPRYGTAAAPAPPAGSGSFQSSGGRPPRWDRSGGAPGRWR